MKKLRLALTVVLFIVCAVTVIIFEIPDLIVFGDKTLGALVSATVPRIAVAAFLCVLLMAYGYGETLKPVRKGFLKRLVWTLPCFLVAFANFPYSALISGSAQITRTDLIWLFIIKCLSIALMEELFFRVTLVSLFKELFEKRRFCILLTVVLSSAVFALTHLINLFYGAGAGATFLQVGYTFLIGCMLAVTLIYTKNVWLCVAVHTLFDIGGLIVGDLGTGAFQDTVFWVLTAVFGVICAAHIIYTLIRIQRIKTDGGKMS